ncbi:hypothetical protein [Thioalkalivibrio paradoxus]|uniref:Uncharacterized protein n=1 Tax=Thioalkalivibrio paradoxus ARh 1 TaxID=713585 RepID=W0DSP8_9GAMM|nr:hypothetical protein [Thioalkalivibrio paradoxus]AHF00283.1 hypothetical protein THITH_15435 [Thioalkalivibrio paradoxus ARh 1]
MNGKTAQGMTAVLALLGAGIGVSTAQAAVAPGLETTAQGPSQVAQTGIPSPDSRQIKIDDVIGTGAPTYPHQRVDPVPARESNQIKWEYSPTREPHQLKLDR